MLRLPKFKLFLQLGNVECGIRRGFSPVFPSPWNSVDNLFVLHCTSTRQPLFSSATDSMVIASLELLFVLFTSYVLFLCQHMCGNEQNRQEKCGELTNSVIKNVFLCWCFHFPLVPLFKHICWQSEIEQTIDVILNWLSVTHVSAKLLCQDLVDRQKKKYSCKHFRTRKEY